MLSLKRCPSCGKRFGVSSQGRRVLDTQFESEETTSTVPVPTGRDMYVGTGSPITCPANVTLERKDCETSYRCSRCGHAWAENSTVVRRT